MALAEYVNMHMYSEFQTLPFQGRDRKRSHNLDFPGLQTGLAKTYRRIIVLKREKIFGLHRFTQRAPFMHVHCYKQ